MFGKRVSRNNGIALLTRPLMGAAVLALIFGAFVLAGGVMAIAAAIGSHGYAKHWWALVFGLDQIILGIGMNSVGRRLERGV